MEKVVAYGLQFFVPPRDEGVGRCLRENGEFARVELELILASTDGDLLDVGANVGAICLPFAKQRPNAAVVAIEAHRKLSQLLAANALNGGLSNVDVIHAAAGEKLATIEIPLAPLEAAANIGASSLYDKGLPLERVWMRAIDDMAPANLGLVKIDVEGFEPRVLDGAKCLLNEVRPTWLVEISKQRPNTTELVKTAMSAAGYSLFWFFSPFLTPEAGGSATNIRGDLAIFACDGEPPWPMNKLGNDWPTRTGDFPYLARYGFSEALAEQ